MEESDSNIADKSPDRDDNDTADSSEKLLVLPLGEESKKITQVITNDTARQIMQLLAEHSMSVSDIASQLNVPLTTIKYNIENLVDVGLAKVERIKYSEKGRQVKVYAPVRKLIVVVPEKTDSASIADVLKKYLGVIFAAIFASGIVEMLSGKFGLSKSITAGDQLYAYPEGEPGLEYAIDISEEAGDSVVGLLNDTAQKAFINETAPAATHTPLAEEAARIPTSVPTPIIEAGGETLQKGFELDLVSHIGLWFLLGCLFIIALVMVVDYYQRKKR